MNIFYKYIGVILVAGSVAACTDEDYKVYDTTQKDAVFFEYIDDKEEIATSVHYDFNYNIANEYTIEVPVRLMGMPADHERTFKVVPVADKSDMVEDKHYVVETTVLPANAVETILRVKLLRDKDPQLQEKAFTVTLELVESEDLRPVGQKDFTISYSDIRPTERPEWWSTWSPLPQYSFEAAQVFFEYFYRLAPEANQDVFNEMDELYGDYFMKAVSMQGPFAMYDRFLIRYVLMPMYEDYKDVFEWQAVPSL